MKPQERNQIKRCIQEEIEKTRAAIEGQEQDNQSIAPDKAIGRISRMDAMYSQQLNIGTLQRSRERLSKLEYLLNKVDAPDFGVCEFCGEPISAARLKAMPASTKCMRCAAFAG